MKVIVDLCVVPIGVGVHLSPYIAVCEKVLTEADLKIQLHPNGTAPEQILPYLAPASARWWEKLQRFWQHGELLTDDDGAAPAAGGG